MEVPPDDPRLAHIKKVDLTPWHPVRWFVRVYIAALGALSALTLWLTAIAPLQGPKILKAIFLAVGVAQIVFMYSLFMWVRHHQGIYVESFWAFVRGPAPDDRDERQLWVWGRRCYLSWLFGLGTMALMVVAGLVSAGWR